MQEIPKPINAPLQILHMSGCELDSMPDFGVLPNLIELNLSRNPMDHIKPEQLSPLCALENIDLQDETHMSPCDCLSLRMYAGKRSIRLLHFLDCGVPCKEN